MLAILIRSVDRIVNGHCRSSNFPSFLLIQHSVAKKPVSLKNDGLLRKVYKTKNLQIIELYNFYSIKKHVHFFFISDIY